MMRVLSITIPTVVLWTIAAVAVDRFDDRELFVAPPEAIGEGFIRAVTSRRYDQARELLTNPDAMTNNEVRALALRLGDADTIEAETLSRDASRALVTVRGASATISLSLVFEGGGWKVKAEGGTLRYADGILGTYEGIAVMDRSQIVNSNPEILGGAPVFAGTRVPVRTLLVYLEGGETLEEFLDNFPTVSREQAIAFLEESASSLLAQIA
jgi:uncharacterized protein (DUF433 family)